MTTLLAIAATAAAIVLFMVGRSLYRRSVRIRNRLQMDRVFTNISHELLTPLTVVSASIDRLRQLAPAYATDYALMDLNVERMVRLLQEILETSKLQSGELRLLVSQGDVMQHITQTALCLQPLMQKQGLTFTIDCQPKSMMGWIDPDKLDKIIYNLLSNAAKYTRSPGNVRLSVHTNKRYDHIIIRVEDDGIGIAPEKMKHLFQRFADGDYRRMNAMGTGLGLALTRDLVFLHGGTIDCQSRPGEGTTFSVVLPIAKEAFSSAQRDEQHPIDAAAAHTTTITDLQDLFPHADEPQPQTLPEAGADAYRLLLVEDNNELLMLMRMVLAPRYHVATARNGQEALDVLARQEVDLVVSDVMMPEMDGNELTQRLKTTPEWSHLPVILLTARTSDEERQESMRIGADEYIVKPFRLGDLQLRIDNLIENRQRILAERHADSSADEASATALPPTADELFMQRARDCVMEHLADADFDRDAFAQAMGASASTLYKRLRELTGMNVSLYIRHLRLQEAARLARQRPDLRVSDLAYMVGFENPRYFATCFKKEFGTQPSEYRNQNTDSNETGREHGTTVD